MKDLNEDIIYNIAKILYDTFGKKIHIVSSVAIYLQGINLNRPYSDIDIVIDDFKFDKVIKQKYFTLLQKNGINLRLDIIDDTERDVISDYKIVKVKDLDVSVQSIPKIIEHKKLVYKKDLERFLYYDNKLKKLKSQENIYINNIKEIDNNIYKYCQYIKKIFNKDFVICGDYALYLRNIIVDKNFEKSFDIYFINEHYKSITEDIKVQKYKNLLKEKFGDDVVLNIVSKEIKGIVEEYDKIKEYNVESYNNIYKKLVYNHKNRLAKVNKHLNDIQFLEKIEKNN